MKAGKDKVISLHYTLTVDGEKVESSLDRNEPLWILLGHGQLIPGLEKALEGHEAGDTLQAEIAPAEGYGERQEGLTQRVPKKYFKDARLEPGMQAVLPTNFGPRAVTIQKVGMSVVDVDLNHPMAGKDLHFAIEIVEVREASAEEIEHGHVHGDGGHHH